MLWDSNQHVHQVSSNSERVWCSPFGDFTWNDPMKPAEGIGDI